MKPYRKEGANLIITIPLKTTRSNPYMGDDYHPVMDNIIGLFERDYINGLCYRVDMDYAGKGDQLSDYFFKLNDSRKAFDEMIKELGIEAVYES